MIKTKPRIANRSWIYLLAVSATWGAACGKTTEDTADMTPAADLSQAKDPLPIDYYQGTASAALGAQGNQATCATCHSNDGSARSGNTFKDIAYHTSFKGGMAPTLLDGANACVTGWMGGKALTATDKAWLALKSYLESIGDKAKTTPNAIAPEVLANEAAYAAAYAGGNATTGATKYAANCGVCHSGGLQVGLAKADTLAELKNMTLGRIAQKVRTSGPPPSGTMDANDSTPGPMTFFEPSDLSKDDLKDIIAFVRK